MSMIFWIEHYREEYLIEVTTAKLSAPILKDICVHKYTNKNTNKEKYIGEISDKVTAANLSAPLLRELFASSCLPQSRFADSFPLSKRLQSLLLNIEFITREKPTI